VIVLDANILVSAVIGVQAGRVLAAASRRGVPLGITDLQMAEASRVLKEKLGVAPEDVEIGLETATSAVTIIAPEFYGAREAAARRRLHPRAQSDWPVLAAALAAQGGIWSHDRDFFGTGVPVWSSRNMRFAT
jgi:predicted nucleic acid-binding protein